MSKNFRNVKVVNSEVELVKVSENYKEVLADIDDTNAYFNLDEFHSYVFSDYLKNIFFTFRMKLSRYQSLILCERCYSYSIQSQRYCRYDENAEVILEGLDDEELLKSIDMNCILDYLDDCLSIYRALSKLKEGCENKSKFKTEDFKYGIPIEDARYILPMAFTCNQIITLNGMQVLDLLAICKSYINLKELYLKLVNIEEIKTIMEKVMFILPYINSKNVSLRLEKSLIYNNTENNVELNFIDKLDIAGEAALTCTGKNIDDCVDLSKVATRVAGGMKHISILDHVILSYNGCLSVAAYNQLVRHRLQKMNRAVFDISIFDNPIKEMIIPDTIKNKSKEYITKLMRGINLHMVVDDIEILFKKYFDKFSKMANELEYDLAFKEIGDIVLAPLFLMGTKVRFTVINDLSNELYICSKRSCMKAQWEIRDFTYNKLKLLINEIGNKELFKQLAAPGCITGKCPEGRECCGDNTLVKNIFLNI